MTVQHMTAQHLRSSMLRVALGAALAALAAAGCGHDKPGSASVGTGSVPEMPKPIVGQATVAGVVRDGAGAPVAGATVRVAETDKTTMTDAAGAYMLDVPSDSTVTLATSATGFATSYRESMMLADHAAATGVDVMLLAAADVTRFTAMGFPAETATRGLMALRVHSMAASCATDGAHVEAWPPLGAKVLYARPSATGGLDEPDATLDAVQPGAHVAVWLAGAISPGTMLTITFKQAGCSVMVPAPSTNGMMFTGQRRVDAQALTEAELFLQ